MNCLILGCNYLSVVFVQDCGCVCHPAWRRYNGCTGVRETGVSRHYGNPLKPLEHHSTAVLRSLWGYLQLDTSVLCWETPVSQADDVVFSSLLCRQGNYNIKNVRPKEVSISKRWTQPTCGLESRVVWTYTLCKYVLIHNFDRHNWLKYLLDVPIEKLICSLLLNQIWRVGLQSKFGLI